jgi:hypothetical protein
LKRVDDEKDKNDKEALKEDGSGGVFFYPTQH